MQLTRRLTRVGARLIGASLGRVTTLAAPGASLMATHLSRLHAAGAVLLGKLNLTERATAGFSPTFDVPRNPWNTDCWPGLSSSGAGVAAAAGLCFAAIGTDTGKPGS